ncbi:immunity protein Imm5 [Pendulispora rubella]|uniref:Immunity protein Imm5 n=1 Tax=Pendulispora rubella TaxID=2741070 RepID=A0ABZ2KTQ7_9BACT
MNPAELEEAVAAGEAALRAASDGALPLQHRRQIWLALGPVERQGNLVLVGEGAIRRSSLASAAVARVLPLWRSKWPNETTPEKLLSSVGEYIEGRLGRDDAIALADDFFATLEGEYPLEDSVTSVGQAAVIALKTPIFERGLDPEYAHCKADDELDPWGWDAAFAASIAAAEGAPWEQAGLADRRRDFWRWYLQQARMVAAEPLRWTSPRLHGG